MEWKERRGRLHQPTDDGRSDRRTGGGRTDGRTCSYVRPLSVGGRNRRRRCRLVGRGQIKSREVYSRKSPKKHTAGERGSCERLACSFFAWEREGTNRCVINACAPSPACPRGTARRRREERASVVGRNRIKQSDRCRTDCAARAFPLA